MAAGPGRPPTTALSRSRRQPPGQARTAEAPRGATSGGGAGFTFTASSERRAPPRGSRTALSGWEDSRRTPPGGKSLGVASAGPGGGERRGGLVTRGWGGPLAPKCGGGEGRKEGASQGGQRWGAAWSPPQTG